MNFKTLKQKAYEFACLQKHCECQSTHRVPLRMGKWCVMISWTYESYVCSEWKDNGGGDFFITWYIFRIGNFSSILGEIGSIHTHKSENNGHKNKQDPPHPFSKWDSTNFPFSPNYPQMWANWKRIFLFFTKIQNSNKINRNKRRICLEFVKWKYIGSITSNIFLLQEIPWVGSGCSLFMFLWVG